MVDDRTNDDVDERDECLAEDDALVVVFDGPHLTGDLHKVGRWQSARIRMGRRESRRGGLTTRISKEDNVNSVHSVYKRDRLDSLYILVVRSGSRSSGGPRLDADGNGERDDRREDGTHAHPAQPGDPTQCLDGRDEEDDNGSDGHKDDGAGPVAILSPTCFCSADER